MINNPCSTSRQGLAPANNLTLIQHNSLGSWDVFLSLFSSLAEGPPPTSFSSKTPPPPRDFSLASQDLNPLPPQVEGPEWPATCPKTSCAGSQYYPPFPPRQTTLCC